MVADDGRKFDFIVKCGEDLRQDERIEQIFKIANKTFENAGEGSKLSIRTYDVMPLSSAVGLIECIPDVVSYKELAKPENWKHSKGEVGTKDALMAKVKLSCEQRAAEFEGNKRNVSDKNQLKKSLLSMSSTAEGFFFLRDNFIRTHAVHSVVGWLLSLADRHADNLLISKVTADSIPIDFGQAFGYTAFLPCPELPPFRLTPQIQSLLLPFTPEKGPFKETMTSALACVRKDADIFNAALAVFIQDMTKDWITLAEHQAKLSKAADPKQMASQFPLEKKSMVRRKLEGAHPSMTILEELKFAMPNQSKKDAKEFVANVEQVLLGPDSSVRRKCWENKSSSFKLNVEDQVACLIEMAVDPSILMCAYTGWSPLI